MATTRQEASALTREALLQAGEDLLFEVFLDGRLDPAQVLKPSAIAARAGRSKGMLYHLWPVPEDNPDRLAAYRTALLDRLSWRTAVNLDDLRAIADDLQGRPASQFPRLAANWLIGTVGPGGERWLMHRMVVMLAIAAEAREAGRPSTPLSTGLHLDPALEQFYADMLEAMGREMTPPFTIAHLGAMLWAVLDGVAVNLASSPALSDVLELEGDENPWTSCAVIADAVITRITRPIAG
jgi:AcrR family transcriptional regulator